MKVAITGHTAGIGHAFAQWFEQAGHEVVGLSRRTGTNIRSIPKTVDKIVDCDMWINNAQAGYAQTELLYKVWEQWQGQEDKAIWLISTLMTSYTDIPDIPGLSQIQVAEYKNQKQALEQCFLDLRTLRSKPAMTLVKPGAVATQPGQEAGKGYDDVNEWAATICESYQLASKRGQHLVEISVGHRLGVMQL